MIGGMPVGILKFWPSGLSVRCGLAAYPEGAAMQFDPSKFDLASPGKPGGAEKAPSLRPKDMRTWIADLDAAGELIRIDKPVDPLTEMGSLLYQSREKALLFEKLPHGWRSLGQAPANVRHAALAFGTSEEALVPCVADRMGRCSSPIRVNDGPVKELK